MERLRSYAILDTAAEKGFDDLVQLAARICGAPMAAVSLVDSDRQWFKARLGLTASQTDRSNSFCAHGIAEDSDMLIVPDARLDERFAQLPLVKDDPRIQFYTGAQLSDADGHALGMLCVMDRVPRKLDQFQQDSLRILARQVVSLLELHREAALHEASREELEQSRRELLKSDALYHSLVEHLPLFLLRKDRAGRITFANKRFCDVWHCSAAALLGKTDFDLLPRETAAKFRATDRRVLDTGEVVETVEKIARGDGPEIHIQIITSPLTDRHGDIVGVQVISKDVSESHRLQIELQSAHAELERRVIERTAELETVNTSLKEAVRRASDWKDRYDLIIASAKLAVYDMDRITAKVVWGRGAENVLGLEPTALNRASDEWLDLVHPQDRATVMRRMEDARVDGLPFDVQYRLRRGANYHRWIRDRGFLEPDTQGRCIRILGLMEDITQRKLAEETMREQAALLDQTQDAIMVRDLDNHVLYWNQTAERLYGWTVGEALARPIQDLLLHGESAHITVARTTALQQGAWAGEVKVFTKAGRELTIHSRWTLLRDDDGNPHGFLVAHTDVTEQKMLEAKFLRAQRLESLGALASGIAHDLNNVFTPILMSVDLLRGKLDDATRANTLGILTSSARRGSDMVRQVLSFARGGETGPGLVQLKYLLSELEKMMRDTFPHNIRIERNVAPDLRSVRGDATQLYQVLMNLCINARDAMPDGGVLRLEASNHDLECPRDGAAGHGKPGPYVYIAVTDNGTGMSPEVQRRIFEPFFTTKEIGKGTGLGLSTVVTLVQAHAGFLDVETEPGAGTRFIVHLPSERSKTVEPAAAAKAPGGHGELLLVVDDEAAIREILKTTLEANDYNVLLAAEGAEAVALYAAHREKIALVITDLAMPVLDGRATMRALRKINPEVRLIAGSGFLEPDKLEQLREPGVTTLTKPYSPDKLLNAIHLVLNPVTA